MIARFSLAVALCLVAAALVSAQTSISGNLSFKANANVSLDSKGSVDFAWRSSSMVDFTVPGIAQAVAFSSQEVSASGNIISGGSVQANLIFGGAFSLLSKVPATWLAYYNTTRTLDITSPDFYTQFNVDSSVAGYVMTAYTRLVERDPSGAEVKSLSLKGENSLTGNFVWSRSGAQTSGDIKFMTISGTDKTKSGFSIFITFVVSTKVGILEYGNTVVQPRSLETIIEINNWPYANSANTLGLEMVVGSGSASLNARELVSTVSGKVYFRAASGVSVDGKDAAVSASGWVDVSFSTDLPGNLKNHLEGKYGSLFTLKKNEIKFPAGAAKIVYDPTIGQGEMINAAFSLRSISVAFFALAALVAMLVM